MNENPLVSAWPNNEARKGWAARVMLAEDARWVTDIVMSAQKYSNAKAYPALLLGHHFVRIAYEGAAAIRSSNPHVGWPPFSDLLTDQYAAITKRGRHVSKLLDDTKKSSDEVLSDLAAVLAKNSDAFLNKAPMWFRRRETDMGLYHMNGSILGASIPMSYRLDIDPGDQKSLSGGPISGISEEWGSTIGVLSAADLRPPDMNGHIDLSRCEITTSNELASRFLEDKYEAKFPIEVKALMLLLEGDLNTNRWFLPATEAGHELTVFRARTATVYHSLSALRKIERRFSELDSPGMRDLRSLLSGASAGRLMSREAALVRNRCVHYEINTLNIQLDPSRPMSGIIEAVYPGNTWENFNDDVLNVTEQLAEHLSEWQL